MRGGFSSAAFVDIADPDDMYVHLDVLPAHAVADPAAWARTFFSVNSLPPAVRGPMKACRALTTRSRPPEWTDAFAVRQVVGGEAVVAIDSGSLDMRVAVGIDENHALIRVVTVVRYKGPAARYVTPSARVLAPHLIRGMLRRSRKQITRVTH